MAGSTSGATTVTTAPASSRPRTLPAATRPPPTTRHGRPSTTRLTGYSGCSTGTAARPSDERRDGPRGRHPAGGGAGGAAGLGPGLALLVEAQDLQLDGQVDLAQRH